MDFMKLKDPKVDEEFENFLMKVTSVSNIIRDMCSDDDKKAEIATRKADRMLGKDNIEINEEDIHVKKSRTVINQKAFNELGKKDGPQTLSPEEFMKSVEKDANERAERRRMKKEVADGLMKRGNKYFRNKEYEKALNLYNQALDEVHDSCLLYTNHALTCLHLGLYERVIKDCDKALQLDENNLKALLYKARALMWMADEENAGKFVEEALEKHPQHSEYIKDFVSKWEEQM